jgi:uncharacterized protein
MPEYLNPGVYIEEIEPGPRRIEGMPTRTADFLGETQRASVTPPLVTSCKEYERWFGGFLVETKFKPYAVRRFFENSGSGFTFAGQLGYRLRRRKRTFRGYIVRAVGPASWAKRACARIGLLNG